LLDNVREKLRENHSRIQNARECCIREASRAKKTELREWKGPYERGWNLDDVGDVCSGRVSADDDGDKAGTDWVSKEKSESCESSERIFGYLRLPAWIEDSLMPFLLRTGVGAGLTMMVVERGLHSSGRLPEAIIINNWDRGVFT
jgi:hypothetical protein